MLRCFSPARLVSRIEILRCKIFLHNFFFSFHIFANITSNQRWVVVCERDIYIHADCWSLSKMACLPADMLSACVHTTHMNGERLLIALGSCCRVFACANHFSLSFMGSKAII